MPTSEEVIAPLRRIQPYLLVALAIAAIWVAIRVWLLSGSRMVLFTAVIYFVGAACSFASLVRERNRATDALFGTFVTLTWCYGSVLMELGDQFRHLHG